jgi:hypothetical protein
LKRNKVIESRDIIFSEKNKWDWKKKNVESVFLEMNAQEETSGMHVSENEDEEEEPFSLTMDARSSSSTPSSTPVKMRRLN